MKQVGQERLTFYLVLARRNMSLDVCLMMLQCLLCLQQYQKLFTAESNEKQLQIQDMTGMDGSD